jgi:enoyl-CoA hydratase/carnithine racemase
VKEQALICVSNDEGGRVRVRVQRAAKRNAITRGMWRSLLAALETAASDDGVRALTIEGSDGVFSAGADLQSVKTQDGTVRDEYRDLALTTLSVLEGFPRPTLALVDGPCIGAGCSLALACDVRFATTRSTFAIPALRHGIMYERQSIERLVSLVGPSQTERLLLAGIGIDGHEAERIGLVDSCTDRLEGTSREWLDEVMRVEPIAIQTMRALIKRASREHQFGKRSKR